MIDMRPKMSTLNAQQLIDLVIYKEVDWDLITKRVDADIEAETKTFMLKELKGGRRTKEWKQ